MPSLQELEDEYGVDSYVEPTKKGRPKWAVELSDPAVFYQYVINEAEWDLAGINTTELNKIARKMKGTFNIPGIRAYEKGDD